MGGRRQEPARELVHALRAALEARDPALDAEVDRLVIARLEMQARHVFARAPVAAPKRRGVEDVERGAQALPVAVAEHEHHVRGEAVRDALEELERQVWRRVVGAIRAAVAVEEERQVAGADVAADAPLEPDARFAELAPLLPDLLALVVAHRREEIREVAIALVAPVELHAFARDHARGRRLAQLRLVDEEHVQRRIAVA